MTMYKLSFIGSRGKSAGPGRLSCAAALLITALMSTTASAQNCEVEERVERLGHKSQPRSRTLDNLSEVTDVALLRAYPGWSSCPAGSFGFEDNRVTTNPGCRGDFQVSGIKKDCITGGGSSEISQVPLFLNQQSEPNVMFMLDDSGSMQFEIMPDRLVFFDSGRAPFLYPIVGSNVYGSNSYGDRVVTVDDVAYNAIARSPQHNSVYYNPGVTYSPWIKDDGSLFPDASPDCAPHNPDRPGLGCRKLTDTNSNDNDTLWISCDQNGNCSRATSGKNFWPATYFWHKGGDAWTFGNYDRVEIRISTTQYTGQDRQFRSDCLDADNAVCSYAEEIQNFANWYTYYRSRILAARAGIGYAFSQQGSGMRVGFGTINQAKNTVDGVDTIVVDEGVRRFTGSARKNFYDNLYSRDIPAAGTPLREALDAAGQYFSRTDNAGPWGNEPGTNDNTEHSSCRRSYSVLMTDGFWSGGSNFEAQTEAARDDNDSSDGPKHTGPSDLSFQYKASAPFADNRGNTLADVAMYYWKRDLRTDLDNNVAPLDSNPAFWQHMSTFGVGLGVSGTIEPARAFSAIDSGDSINWPDPRPDTQNCSGDICPARLDDLLHAGVNSRGGFFSASNPNEFSSELAKVLQTIAVETQSSASSIATNSTRLDTGTLVYQARFDTRDWSSQLLAFDLNADGSLKSVVWNTDNAGLIPNHASRAIFTSKGSKGQTTTSAIDFTVDNWNSFTDDQRVALRGGGSDDDGKDVIRWLRGDQSKESESGQRERDKLLGDIINSDPFFVGNTENFGYSQLGGTEGSSYADFLNTETGKAGRRNMLYVGANDGMLHGFDALTGKEIFAFIPRSVYENLPELTRADYRHRYYVDGSPRAGDAYLGDSWRTVLVSSTGAGGRSVFALDITDPDSMGPEDLLWEFATTTADTNKLGVAMSDPVIARVKADNRWVTIFGNGYNTGDNVKLMIVDLETGTLVKAIDTGLAGDNNGLATVVPVDSNGDRITDVVYAGDLKGNLWKFDLSADNSNGWDVAIQDNGKPAPLFTAVDADGNPQPITARPVVGNHDISGLMVYFGTGKYFETSDGLVEANPQIQDFYGIRDENRTVKRADLLTQTIVFEGTGTLQNNPDDDSDNSQTDQAVRVVSNNGAGSPTSHGWHLKLLSPNASTGTGERAVSRPILRSGRIIFATIIPDSNPCGFGGNSWLMEVDAATGGRLGFSVFDINDDTFFTEGDYIKLGDTWVPVSGLGHEEMIKTPGIVGAGEREYKYTSGSSGSIGVTREKSGNSRLGRQSWRQLQ